MGKLLMRKTIILLALTLLVFAADRVYYQVGDTTPAGAFLAYGANFVYYHRFVNTQAGRLDSLGIYLKTAPVGMKAAIYTHVSATNRPGTIIDSTNTGSPSPDDWLHLAFANEKEIAADTFWIGVNSTTAHNRAKGEGGDINWGFQSRTFTLGWLGTATLSGADNWDDVDIYLTISTASGVAKRSNPGYNERNKY